MSTSDNNQVRSTWSKYFAKYAVRRAEAYLCQKYDRPVTGAEISAALEDEPIEVEDVFPDAVLSQDDDDALSDSELSDEDPELDSPLEVTLVTKSHRSNVQNSFLEITAEMILAQMDKGNMVLPRFKLAALRTLISLCYRGCNHWE
jgi:hypothetical protein